MEHLSGVLDINMTNPCFDYTKAKLWKFKLLKHGMKGTSGWLFFGIVTVGVMSLFYFKKENLVLSF